MKLNDPTDCRDIKELPPTIAMETERNRLLIDTTEDVITIICKDKQSVKISPKECPLIIEMENECYIKSRSLEISKGVIKSEEKDINIKEDKADIEITRLQLDPWKPYIDLKERKNITFNNTEDELTDLVKSVDNQIEKANRDISKLDIKTNITMDIAAI